MPIVKHVAIADMTADSHHFRTKEQLIAEGWEQVCYPPCDYHTPADTDGAMHPGVSVRPKDRSRSWMWFGSALDQRLGYDYRTWEAICDLCLEMLRMADKRNHCRECGDWIIAHGGRCEFCWEEYEASVFGDYRPPTDCGCAWHNIYRVDENGEPSCYGRPLAKSVHSTTRYEPGDKRTNYAALFAEAMNV